MCCFQPALDKPRQESVPLLLVLVAKVVSQRPFLIPRPAGHVRHADTDEQHDSPFPRNKNNTNPRDDLEHVVGTCDQAASNTRRDALLCAARLAKASQVLVHYKVGRLASKEQRNAHIVQQSQLGTRGERARRVDEVGGHEASGDPVEDAVLDNVEGGHGGSGEAVQEGGLKLALDEMADKHVETDLLDNSKWDLVGVFVKVRVDLGELGAHGVEKGVEENRAEVFDEVDGAP